MTRFFSSDVITRKCFWRKSSFSSLVQETRGKETPARAARERLRSKSLRVYLLVCMWVTGRSIRGRLGFQRFEFRVMGIVTVGTEQIGYFAPRKIPTPFPMDAGFPIVVDVAMAFTAQAVTLIEPDELPVI